MTGGPLDVNLTVEAMMKKHKMWICLECGELWPAELWPAELRAAELRAAEPRANELRDDDLEAIVPDWARGEAKARDFLAVTWREARELEDEWERQLEFLERDDEWGMVAYCENLVQRRPDDLDALRDLGEAYLQVGEHRKVIQLLAVPHARNPDYLEFQYILLDALFALGLDETHFPWQLAVPVLRLGPAVLDLCRAYVATRPGPSLLADVYLEALQAGYCAFSADELLAALRQDERFRVDGAGTSDGWTLISLSSAPENPKT